MVNERFPLLSVVSMCMRLAGGLVILVGLYYAAYEGVLEPNLPNHTFTQNDAMQLAGGLLLIVVGLATVALGEIIGVLFAIEENTRTM